MMSKILTQFVTEIMPFTANTFHFLTSIPFCLATMSWLNESIFDYSTTICFTALAVNISVLLLQEHMIRQRSKETLCELTKEGLADCIELRLFKEPQMEYLPFNGLFSHGIISSVGGNLILPKE
ncbi:hypothetical protein BLNAU_21542 [Blattamonas nauphoetae]|uniref:Uncharacterized protein n=1 Tax=Blattamonas nauphoetae TaxID=2049346 RepID=A0ABQ9WZV2_9EUKA|nr:hypothetical protein BLNAU_21542 [Blattamonas nauphoetae]